MERLKGLAHQIENSSGKQTLNKGPASRQVMPTGSTMLNLGCSDLCNGGYGTGKMVNLIGDSSSGKTLLALSMLAEMAYDKDFDEYELYYDDVESANEFDLGKMFGKKAAGRILSPNINEDGTPKSSDTIQSFHSNIMKHLDKPFIWVLDSFDALSSDEEYDRTEKALKAHEEGKSKELPGSYKMEKAKLLGETLRMIIRKLKHTKSLLLIISQTRDNIDPKSFIKKTRSGGNALRFYATHEIWLAVKEKIESRRRVIGVLIKAKVTKNKFTGKLREIEFPIYYDYGVDDIGACIDFMVKEKFWEQKKLTIIAPDLDIEGTRQTLVQQIEEGNLERKLKRCVQKAWQEIEDSLKLNRKSKFK